MMEINIGISSSSRSKIAKGLSHLLADTYTLYLKTHKFHWNVTGPQFQTLHELFEKHYQELAIAVDDIAERIRVLGIKAPGTYREFIELSSIKEDEDNDIHALEMLKSLLSGHEQVVQTAKGILPMLEGANDEGTAALLSERIEIHEKTAWMLASLIEED